MKKQTISIMSLSGIAALFYSLSFFVFFVTSLLVESVYGTSGVDVLHGSMINALVENRWFFCIAFISSGYFGVAMLVLEIKLIQGPKLKKILLITAIMNGLICSIIGLYMLMIIV